VDGDVDLDVTFVDFCCVVDILLDRELGAQKKALVARIPHDPAAIVRYREVDQHWKEVKARLSAQRAEEE